MLLIVTENCCLPSILNFSCLGYKPEVILHDLETKEIYLSTRSACSSKTSNVSRVMAQLHLDELLVLVRLELVLESILQEKKSIGFVIIYKKVCVN